MSKIAIYGGTFNPVHNGHIEVVNQVKSQLKCDKVIIVPTLIPPHKTAQELASNEARLEMCRIAFEDEITEISDFEMQSGGKSYTYLTLQYFKEKYPDDELYFVMGSDMLFTFLKWRNPDIIMSLATLVCICRSDEDVKSAGKYAREIQANGGECILLNCKPVEVSSTEIRAIIASEDSAEGLTSKEVLEYIFANNLYNFDKSIYNNYREYLKENLSEKRYIHSVNVANSSLRLAILNKCDTHKAYLAGLLHDICKELPYEKQSELMQRSEFPITKTELLAPKTWHGIAAAVFVKEHFGITDNEVLSAIRYHTVAKADMSLVEKAVYLADLISKERVYADVEDMRASSYLDMNLGMYKAMCFTLNFSVEHKRTVPEVTLEAYNEFTQYYKEKYCQN